MLALLGVAEAPGSLGVPRFDVLVPRDHRGATASLLQSLEDAWKRQTAFHKALGLKEPTKPAAVAVRELQAKGALSEAFRRAIGLRKSLQNSPLAQRERRLQEFRDGQKGASNWQTYGRYLLVLALLVCGTILLWSGQGVAAFGFGLLLLAILHGASSSMGSARWEALWVQLCFHRSGWIGLGGAVAVAWMIPAMALVSYRLPARGYALGIAFCGTAAAIYFLGEHLAYGGPMAFSAAWPPQERLYRGTVAAATVWLPWIGLALEIFLEFLRRYLASFTRPDPMLPSN